MHTDNMFIVLRKKFGTKLNIMQGFFFSMGGYTTEGPEHYPIHLLGREGVLRPGYSGKEKGTAVEWPSFKLVPLPLRVCRCRD